MQKVLYILVLFVATTCLALPMAAQPGGAFPAVQPLELGKGIERELKAGEIHSYTVSLQAGEFLHATADQRGIDLVVRVTGPDGAMIVEVDSPNGSSGPEPVSIAAKTSGVYRLDIASLEKEAAPGRYEIKIDELLSAEQYAVRLEKERAKRAAVIKWLTANAKPIKTVEAGNGYDDLRFLKPLFKNVRFVGLGEETHGTREFFQFKHRMLEFLVREMGFRVFAIEASYAGCLNINDYIMGVTNDGASALASQGFWTWNTEEVRAILDWLRAYNQGVPADKKVKFIGFDIQANSEAFDYALAYLRRVAPDRAAEIEALPRPIKINAGVEEAKVSLETLVENAVRGPKESRPAAMDKLDPVRAKYNELLGFLALHEPQFVKQTSADEFRHAMHSVRVIDQYIDAYSARRFDLRDVYMADNLNRMAGDEPPETRFVVWAHNGHIDTSTDGTPGFGAHLRRYFGSEYYAVGFSFDHGGFQSRETNEKISPTGDLTGYVAGPAPEGSVDWFLKQAGKPISFLDFRSSSKNDEITEWLNTPLQMRSIGSGYSAADETRFFSPIKLAPAFDGLFFVDTTTRARPNPGVRGVAAGK